MSYIPRVTQLDASHLDDQVAELFKQQLFEATKYLEPGLLQPILPELELILRTWIFKYSVYNNQSTFGQQMLSLKYNKENFSKAKLYWYFGYTVALRYLKERAIYNFTMNTRIQNIISSLETFHLISDIFNFLRFLQSGKHPSLIDFILGLDMKAETITRIDLTDLTWTRELLWNNFIELIGTIISLMNIFGLRSRITGMMKYLWWKQYPRGVGVAGPVIMNLNTVCACCSGKPILPHTMGCCHVFCYYCITTSKMADKDFPCPTCHYNGTLVTKVVST